MMYGQAQTRLTRWATRVFGIEHVQDPVVRGKRLLEEAVEFAQSIGVSRANADGIVEHIYSRPAGVPEQELGGVSLTFLAACTSLQLDARAVTKKELDRVESKPDEHFQQRNAQKKRLFG